MAVSSLPLTIPVDAEHGGKRAAGCASLLVGFIATFTIVVTLIPDGWIIGFIAGLVGAAAAASLTERALRDRWPSGRTLHISPQAIQLRNRDQVEHSINPEEHVNAMPYHFVVKRNGRVRKGWHVVVLALEQDETYVPVYTFASPEEFEALAQRPHFHLLERPKEDSLKSAGLTRRLYAAESHRSVHGAEIRLQEFTELLDTLQEQFPQWMPKS